MRTLRASLCAGLFALAFATAACGQATGVPAPLASPAATVEVAPPTAAPAIDPAVAAANQALFAGETPLLYVGGDGRIEDQHLYRSDADGGNRICITCASGMRGAYSSPVWAPDRSAFAYIYEETSVIMQTRDGLLVTLLSGGGYYRDLSWSPDGARLAFSFEERLASGNRGPGQICVVALAQLSGAQKECLTDSGFNSSPAWSPDGRTLVISRQDQEFQPADLYLLDVDARSLTNLTGTPALSETHPDWHGDRIVYAGREGRVADIWIRDANGADPVCLTAGPEDGDQPAWSPDGARIIFVTTRTSEAWNRDVPFAGYSELYVMNADGFNAQNITNDPRVYSSQPDWGR